MKAISKQPHTSFHRFQTKAEYCLLQTHQIQTITRRLMQVIPFSIASGMVFIGCGGTYATHSQVLTHHMLASLFIMSLSGSIMALLSLITEKGSLHKLQAVSGLMSNILLVILFFNLLANFVQA